MQRVVVNMFQLDNIDGTPIFTIKNIASITELSERPIYRILKSYCADGQISNSHKQTGGWCFLLTEEHQQVSLFYWFNLL